MKKMSKHDFTDLVDLVNRWKEHATDTEELLEKVGAAEDLLHDIYNDLDDELREVEEDA